MVCPKCGHEINHEQFPLGLAFCPYCGDKVSDRDPRQTISFCPYCGRRILIAATFCPECGKQVSADRAISRTAEPLLMPSSSAPPISGATYQRSSPSYQLEVDDIPQDPAMATAPSSPQSVWPKVATICKRAYEPVESLVTGRWRLKRLYKDWSAHDALPPDEIPSDDYLKKTPYQGSSPDQRLPLWLLVLAIGVAIILFVIIGILIGRS